MASPVNVGTDQVPVGTPLMMIGHPVGLPRKYADDALVSRVVNSGSTQLYYETNVDAFGGNSGSGVFVDDGS